MQMTLQELNPEICLKPIVTAEGFLVRLSQLLESEEVSTIHEELCSLKLCDSQLYENLNIFSLRMSKDCFPTMEEKLSELSSSLYGNVGTMRNGRCATLKIMEYPKTGKGCSLSDILEANVPEKYFLSKEQTDKIIRLSKLTADQRKLEVSQQGT